MGGGQPWEGVRRGRGLATVSFRVIYAYIFLQKLFIFFLQFIRVLTLSAVHKVADFEHSS